MAEPTDLLSNILAVGDALEAASKRFPVERTGPRAPIPAHVRLLVLKRDKFRCDWCGASERSQPFHLDHIIPWSAGGSDRTSNLRVLCPSCNENRSNYRTDAAYARRLPCVPQCQPCYNDELGPDDVSPESVVRVFCGSCNRPSWVVHHPGYPPL